MGGDDEDPRVDLIGEVDGRDQMDFSGETGGGRDGELGREPSPDLAWTGTVAGADDHAW